ncbi:MAG: efflux RND transporter permease subunit [bacterium]|nr:efflux RND transporter permease subunit [bacterium]
MSRELGLAGKIGAFFIDSKLTPLLVVAALALGVLAISQTPREEEPQIVVPIVDIFVGLPGATPEEVENRVTVPLEKRMWEIPGVEYVYSASRPGASMVTVRFYVGDDQERSLVKVYSKLASGLDKIPPGATPPLVKPRTIDDVPVVAYTLWSERYDAFELRRLAMELERELATLDDVAEMRVIGGQRRQLRLLLDPARMAASGVDPSAAVFSLQVQNAAASAGAFEAGNRELLVETGAFLRDRDEVASLVVGVHGGRPVYLRDVAEIVDGAEQAETHVFFRSGASAGEIAPTGLAPAVTLAVAKRQGADAESVVAEVKAKVRELTGRLIPEDVELTVTRDYGSTAAEKAEELLLHLILAIVSVSIVIGLALGWRGALVVFISVPVSFALTLFVYYVFGYTLNRVTLFALIFVTGIVVDDSIIVVENIVRHLSRSKKPPLEAALAAVNEVGNPTILATLTVIAAVLPMAFVRGLMGPYMLPMPVGASLAMTFSLLVALIAAPWFAYRLVRADGQHREEGEGLEESRIYRLYRRLLVPLLRRPRRAWVFLGTIAALLLASVALFPLEMVSVKMLPFDNKSELQVVLDLPEGTTLETTSQVAREVADDLATVAEVTDIQLYVGTSAPINFNGLVRHYDLRAGSNVADLQVNLRHKKERSRQSHEIAKSLRPRIQEIALRHGAAAKIVEVPPGPPVLSTLLAEIYGPTQEERQRVARQVREVFATTEGVVDVDWWVEDPQTKLVFEVDREKAALHWVPAAKVVQATRLALSGEDVGVLHDEDEVEPVTIRLELPRAERSSEADLGDVQLASMKGTLVPLSELVRLERAALEPTLHRKNLKPVIYVSADVAGVSESPVYAIMEMSERIGEIELPAGGSPPGGRQAVYLEQLYRAAPWSTEQAALKWDGEWHITYEVFRDLGAAFGAVLILIYLLIVGWFGSFRVPLVMMIAIPLSLVGILPGHWLLGAFFTATSMIGFIALAGIMVRNSVLLIDFVELALADGKSLAEAVVEAGSVRFRPILLTAGTVVVGAFVILFDPIFEGLAIALMTGAIASTVLTLVVVPLVYFMVERRHHPRPWPEEWQKEAPRQEQDEPPAHPA